MIPPNNKITSERKHHKSSRKNLLSHFLFLLPIILLIPALYYSLTTPFALVDDYGQCYYVEFLDSTKRFMGWWDKNILSTEYGRYRPFFDLYNMVTWKIFGAHPWLHHLCRWGMHIVSILCFAAAFIQATDKTNQQSTSLKPNLTRSHSLLLPLFFLVYIWLFFPNSPVARLGPQELFTVFFLGICNWMLVRLMAPLNRNSRLGVRPVSQGLFYVACLGLAISKEVNIAVLLWITIFWCTWLLWRHGWKKIYLGLPLLLLLAHTLYRVYMASKGHYGTAAVTLELLTDNAAWVAKELFQVHTSPVISVIMLSLLLFLSAFIAVRLKKRHIDTEILYVLFLAGQFLSIYAMVSTSWAQVLRYWYPLIPIFSCMLAFSVRYIRFAFPQKYKLLSTSITILLGFFMLFFIGCNYYNFLLQTVTQHSLRTAEAVLIKEIKELYNDGEHVQILLMKNDPEAELVFHLRDYFNRFSSRFFHEKYQVYLHKPKQLGKTYYSVTMHKQPGPLTLYRKVENRQDYSLLNKTANISAFFQQKKYPYIAKDAGVHLIDQYQWYIYKKRT